jgi:hypothetical protein
MQSSLNFPMKRLAVKAFRWRKADVLRQRGPRRHNFLKIGGQANGGGRRGKSGGVRTSYTFFAHNIVSSVVNVGKANAPTDGRLPSQHIISHTGLNRPSEMGAPKIVLETS